jgi:hypothetical protein
VEIVVRSLTLLDCGTCVRTEGGSAAVVIATDGPVVCEANQEAIRAEGSSFVQLESVFAIDLASGGVGIRAGGNSEVALASPGMCIVDSFEPFRIRRNAVVDTTGCADLDLDSD